MRSLFDEPIFLEILNVFMLKRLFPLCCDNRFVVVVKEGIFPLGSTILTRIEPKEIFLLGIALFGCPSCSVECALGCPLANLVLEVRPPPGGTASKELDW